MYWKLFDRFRESLKCHSSPQITTKQWAEYFHSHVNAGLYESDAEIEKTRESFVNENIHSVFNELSLKITEAEISKSIDKLTEAKASGIDFVLNEMLKAGGTILMPVLVKFFNKITPP